MRVHLAYGHDGLDVELPAANLTVIEPSELPGLADEAAALRLAMDGPIASRPLNEVIAPSGSVAIVFPDVTRPMPSSRVLPMLLDYLEAAGVTQDRIVLLSGTGTHRANTPEELAGMVGPRVMGRYRIINHDCRDAASLTLVGRFRDGAPFWLNRYYVEAQTRILTGFIEPHFFAGFSGGPKGACPGFASLETVLECHNIDRIGSPMAAYGILDGNPVHEMIDEAHEMMPSAFSLDVTINSRREITGVFAGRLPESHRRGCEFVRRTAMQPVARRFDVVITTNSGYPLDQNLYQTVKGMAAAARIVRPGGVILTASECSDGLPNGGHYAHLLECSRSPEEALGRLAPAGRTIPDQWEVQVQALIQKQARCLLHSTLSDAQVRSALMEPVASVEQSIDDILREQPDATIAVLPQGPQTIAYVAD